MVPGSHQAFLPMDSVPPKGPGWQKASANVSSSFLLSPSAANGPPWAVFLSSGWSQDPFAPLSLWLPWARHGPSVLHVLPVLLQQRVAQRGSGRHKVLGHAG